MPKLREFIASCPFCGGNDVGIAYREPVVDGDLEQCLYWCAGCLTAGPMVEIIGSLTRTHAEDIALARWNRRAVVGKEV